MGGHFRIPAIGAVFAATWLLGAVAGDGRSVQAQSPLQLRATLYYTALEEDYAAGNDAAFLSRGGRVLHRTSKEFYDAAAIEGSARLSNGVVLNYRVRTPDGIRWKLVESEYGQGADGCGLVPFRSAAVDPKIIPLGHRIRIAETIGMPLPDGSTHDGIWWAHDIGDSITGDRIDLFTGAGIASMDTLFSAGIDYLAPLSVEVLDKIDVCSAE